MHTACSYFKITSLGIFIIAKKKEQKKKRKRERRKGEKKSSNSLVGKISLMYSEKMISKIPMNKENKLYLIVIFQNIRNGIKKRKPLKR